jgi:hypothetical protein
MSRAHLDDRALARAAVDGLSAPQSEHLVQCAACRDQAEHLRDDLTELGRRSRESAPSPNKAFTWSDHAQTSPSWGWRILWSPATGAMAAALILAVVWLGLRLDSPAQVPVQLIETIPLAEIMEAEPEELGGFAGFLIAENSSGFEQDFISAGDEDLGSGAKGVILWPGVL